MTAGGKADPNSAGQALAFDDAAVLSRVRKGETAAFGELVKKYQDRLFNAILRMCGNRDDAEELCQETFVKALENLGRFRQDSRIYTWLFRIAMNLTISHRRHAARGRFVSLEAGGADGELSARSRDTVANYRQDDPHQAVQRSDTHRRVLAALAGLEEQFRAVVVLRDMEDMNYGQIAEVLEIPSGTVKSRLYRARCMLQDKLQDIAP